MIRVSGCMIKLRWPYPLYVTSWGKDNRCSPEFGFACQKLESSLLDELSVPSCSERSC